MLTIDRRRDRVRIVRSVNTSNKTPAGTSRGLPHKLLTDFRRRWLFGFRPFWLAAGHYSWPSAATSRRHMARREEDQQAIADCLPFQDGSTDE